MGSFFISIDAMSSYSVDAPLLEILVDGVVVSSISITTGYTASSLEIDYAVAFREHYRFALMMVLPKAGVQLH